MHSIKFKMLLLMLCLLILISATAVLVLGRVGNDTVIRESKAVVQHLAEEGAERISLEMTHYFHTLTLLASLEEVQSMKLERQMAVLAPKLAATQFQSLAVVEADGLAHYTDGTRLSAAHRPYVQRALAGEPSLSDLTYSPSTGQPVLLIAVPIDSADGSPAALMGQLDGQLLNDMTQAIIYGDRGVAYIINRKSVFQAYPYDPQVAFKKINLQQIATDFPSLTSFVAFAEDALENGSGVGTYKASHSEVYMGYSAIPGTDWVLFSGLADDAVFSILKVYRNRLYPPLIAILLISFLGTLWLAERFTEPVIQLESLFTRAASGDLTVRAQPLGKDEISRAGNSFNHMMKRINQLTYYDSVTGLPNSRVMEDVFEELLKMPDADQLAMNDTLDRHSSKAALWVIEAGNLHRVNEQFGYQQGNQVFKAAAQRLKNLLTEQMTVYRGASNDLLVLCSDYESEQEMSKKLAETILQLDEPYMAGEERITLVFRAGVALYPEHGKNLEELLKNAGFAKNLVRQQPLKQVIFFDEDIRHRELVIRRMEEDLALALEQNQLQLVYQPIYHLETGKIRGAEALLRWHHPQQGYISPEIFIPVAERTGLIDTIGHWVLTEAFRQTTEWKSKGLEKMKISVNLSARQFESPKFIGMVRQLAEENHEMPSKIELELTESTVIHQVEESVEKLKELRHMGFQIAIDDFGTGYSSLSYLVRLPVDTLKIDRSFIMNMEDSSQARSVVSSIIAMGRSLHLELVAEGIETEEQLAMLRQENCQLGQGFYFNSAMTADKFIQLVGRHGQLKRTNKL
ncbi:putative bifunctional diguanylate cyclase/phosphodiesterase [Anoxynatronum buryatiense]|uniref:Diguanylate cyclase (GGDEF) domain-containing protein n=1 Tax=Anoxynatronum buryatiense TaxID=489973 RepID=A0AA45WT63_9CLOT|nr:EAL domain-containing protein [Anoxynatronum buryatiense]SMP40130.1 diguanylate cyclase (GGDEF) domain-containing protein [Anoxynatronum buryatiense]